MYERSDRLSRCLASTLLIVALLPVAGWAGDGDAREQVADVERAFARTMADRDHAAFTSFLSDEAVFIAGTTVRSGKETVSAHWKKFYEAETAPFSWEPETVAILESGKLAISTGPVWNREGQRTATYTSVWRQEEPGVWRIVFDKGDRYCEPEDQE